MRYNIIFKVLVFLLAFGNVFGQSKRDYFVLHGIMNGDYKGYIYLEYNGVKDSCRVVDNKFNFKGKMPAINTVSFVVGKGPTIMTQDFYLENEDIKIEITLAKKTVRNMEFDWVIINSVSGTKSSLIEKEYESFKQKYQNDKNWQIKNYTKIDAIISKYPSHPYSIGLLQQASWDSTADKLRLQQLYKKLDLKLERPTSILRLKKNIFGSSKIGKLMMDFELPNKNNVFINTNQYRGSVLLIDFWASWCAPCRQQIPEIKKLFERYKDKNFKILTISLDKSKQKWISALDKEGMQWDNVLDEREFSSPIVKEYEIVSIPSSFLIDEDGVIVASDLTILELEDYLKNNLKK